MKVKEDEAFLFELHFALGSFVIYMQFAIFHRCSVYIFSIFLTICIFLLYFHLSRYSSTLAASFVHCILQVDA